MGWKSVDWRETYFRQLTNGPNDDSPAQGPQRLVVAPAQLVDQMLGSGHLEDGDVSFISTSVAVAEQARGRLSHIRMCYGAARLFRLSTRKIPKAAIAMPTPLRVTSHHAC